MRPAGGITDRIFLISLLAIATVLRFKSCAGSEETLVCIPGGQEKDGPGGFGMVHTRKF